MVTFYAATMIMEFSLMRCSQELFYYYRQGLIRSTRTVTLVHVCLHDVKGLGACMKSCEVSHASTRRKDNACSALAIS